MENGKWLRVQYYTRKGNKNGIWTHGIWTMNGIWIGFEKESEKVGEGFHI